MHAAVPRGLLPALATAAAPSAMGGTEYVYLDSHMKGIVGAAAAARHAVSGTDKVIAPLFSNQGMLPFLRNLLCSMGRLQVHSWFVVGMDENTCPNLWPGQPAPHAHACVEPYKERPLVSGDKLRFGGSEFWKLVVQRPLWIYWLAQEGYSVLQCDVDTVWLHNPLEYFAARPSYNFFVQSEQTYGVNCGFYFLRPHNSSLTLMKAWLDDMVGPTAHHVLTGGKMHEQHSLVRILAQQRHADKQLRALRLSDAEYPNGKIWYQYMWMSSKKSAYVIHCNWNKNNKKSRLVRDALWFLDDDDRACKPAFDPLEQGCNKNCVPVANGCLMGKRCEFESCDSLLKRDALERRKAPTAEAERNASWHPLAFEHAKCTPEQMTRRRPMRNYSTLKAEVAAKLKPTHKRRSTARAVGVPSSRNGAHGHRSQHGGHSAQ